MAILLHVVIANVCTKTVNPFETQFKEKAQSQ